MRHSKLLLVATITAGCIATGFAQNASLNNQYAKLKKAYWQADARRVGSVVGTNFTWVKPMGQKVGYTEYMRDLRRLFASPGYRAHTVDMKNDSVNVNGDEAWVRSSKRYVYSQRINGRNVTSTITMETVDTWRRARDGWKLFKIQVLSQSEDNSGS